MKKKYVTPSVRTNSFVFRSNIALIFDPNQSGSGQLGKTRDDDFREESDSWGKSSQWENGLW